MSESLRIDSPLGGGRCQSPYSGDLWERVIEAVEMGASRHEAAPYSKFKDHLRKAAKRTVRVLYRTIRAFVPQLGARECANYFRHAGYVSI